MKDVDIVRALRERARYFAEGTFSYDLYHGAAARLEELTKQPEVKPHPQQQWNVGRKNPEDYND